MTGPTHGTGCVFTFFYMACSVRGWWNILGPSVVGPMFLFFLSWIPDPWGPGRSFGAILTSILYGWINRSLSEQAATNSTFPQVFVWFWLYSAIVYILVLLLCVVFCCFCILICILCIFLISLCAQSIFDDLFLFISDGSLCIIFWGCAVVRSTFVAFALSFIFFVFS